MSSMDPKVVREWKARYKLVNEITLDEARARTPEQRFALLKSTLAKFQVLGLLQPREDDLEFHLRWQKLRERYLQKHPRA